MSRRPDIPFWGFLKIRTYVVVMVVLFLFKTGVGEASVFTNICVNGETTVKLYEACEGEVRFDPGQLDPYDPEQIEMTVKMTMDSDGTWDLPVFYTGTGEKWKFRFTPVIEGTINYSVVVITPDGKKEAGRGTIDVLEGTGDGFLRRGKNNGLYPVFDSGRTFFGLGHNLAWVWDNDVALFGKYFSKLQENGCNLTRIWINNPWALSLEFGKLGRYDLEDSEKIDKILDLAARKGIYIMLVFDSYGSIMEEKGFWKEGVWDNNPYNAVNGGPCEKVEQFFTDSEAKRLYRNRIRYMVARWGYSSNIIAFELWNEADTPSGWTAEMSGYLRKINPHGQFVTTSLGYPWSNNFDEDGIWSLDSIGIVDRHVYGKFSGDVIADLISLNRRSVELYDKPVIVGEFGMDNSRNDREMDKKGEGVALHNSIWASTMSGSFCGALNWWWAGYVKANDLYHHYAVLRSFMEGAMLDSVEVSFADTSVLFLSEKDRAEDRDVVIYTKKLWGETRFSGFSVARNGEIAGGYLNHYLQGQKEKRLRIEPSLKLDFPSDGKMLIDVGMVSQGGELIVTIDGKEALTASFPAGKGEGPWQNSFYRPDTKGYQCYYGTRLEVEIPAGKHTVKLSNTGKDWIGIKRITLKGYRSGGVANARILGMKIGEEWLLWIQNRQYNWYAVAQVGTRPGEIEDTFFYIRDALKGGYNVEWWDTFTGEVVREEEVLASGEGLRIKVPPFTKDIACKVKKTDDDLLMKGR